jgi:hypothetical protein
LHLRDASISFVLEPAARPDVNEETLDLIQAGPGERSILEIKEFLNALRDLGVYDR